MKTYLSILFLLAAWVQPLLAQDAPGTKAQPPFPALPYQVAYTAAPEGGEVVLSIFGDPDSIPVAPGESLYPGTEVTLQANPSPDNEVVFGYPKVYCTNAPSTVLALTPVPGNPGRYTFAMPEEPVTVEVMFQGKSATPSSDARLKSLQYKVGSGQGGKWISVPGFTAGTKQYVVTLPSSTPDDEPVTLSGLPAHTGANVSQSQIVLSSGNGRASLPVTAENGRIETYQVVFKRAQAQTYVITIEPVEGGTIAATDSTGKVVRSGDVVARDAVLTLRNTPVAGYAFSRYTVDGAEHTDTSLTVLSNITISGEFAPSAPLRPEDLGEPAWAEATAPGSMADAPLVIIPNSGSLPEDTELSQLRLIRMDIEDAQEAEVMEDAAEEAGKAGIALTGTNMAVIELTLVKVSTVYNPGIGELETSVTPVQPADQMKVRIPYPAGFDTNRDHLVIIHLRSDGKTEIYSREKGNLILASDYMEIIVTGFSPFIVTYANPSSSDPEFFTLTLPAVAGATTDPVPGNYQVEAGNDFRFVLTLDKDYDLSVPVVTTSRNETLESTGGGVYVVKDVRGEVAVTITGIEKNIPVSNETIEAGVKIHIAADVLYIETDRPADVGIVSISGHTIASFQAQAGTTRRALSPGIFIVKVGSQSYKVVVR